MRRHWCILHIVHTVHGHERRVRCFLFLAWQRQLRCCNLATLRFQSLDCLLLLVVDDALLLEVFDLHVLSVIGRLENNVTGYVPGSTHPAVRAILLKFLVKLRAECLGLFSPRLCVYAVEDVVLVQTLEEGITRLVALLAVCPRWRFKRAAGGLLNAAFFGRARAPG